MENKDYISAPYIARFTKILLDILFYFGAAAVVSLHWSMPWAAAFYPSVSDHLIFYEILFALAGIFSEMILWELRKMLCTVLSDNCFIRRNVSSLKRMSLYAFAIAALMAVRVILFFTPGMLAIVCVFLLAGLFSLVLAQVFDRAVSYKQNDDLTI